MKNTNIGKDVSNVLEEFGFPILNAKIIHRISYINSAILGKTVFETESANSSAVLEIMALVSS